MFNESFIWVLRITWYSNTFFGDWKKECDKHIGTVQTQGFFLHMFTFGLLEDVHVR